MIRKIVAQLEAEGVTPARAIKLVEIWDAERILRNIELGAHRTAFNPGGDLTAAIGQDFASKHIRVDSEAFCLPGSWKTRYADANDIKHHTCG